ncbi:MAG: Gfo/Idh/MocA family oxidoreductase [Planctomycetes bacterium]|nr:Gfo/Idh/MocA family oxidoreductase [Planctomycetota bacterium]
MEPRRVTRRRFVQSTLALGAAGLTAAAYGRAAGAADRIRIGQIGCGGRNRWHTQWVKNVAVQANAAVVAACDVWKQQLESMASHIKRRFDLDPKLYADHRKLLEDNDIDAVIIATPDHQHCGQLIDAVQAGKDAYIEKPIAMDMDELNRAYDAVVAAKAVVQHGTQGRSSPGAAACRALHASGKMGRLFRVESTETAYAPYWNHYARPEKESDTDWKAFLYNRPHRPFDPDQHGSWMGYHDFSSGTIGGWMSHFSDFVHAATGCGFPVSAVAHGGIYAPTSDRRRTAPDTVTVVLDYPEGFVTHFSTHFGSAVDNETTVFFFEKGVVRTAFGHNPGEPVVSGEGSDHAERPREKKALELPQTQDHMLNWLECIRTRKAPAADMDAGYKQGVAVVLGDIAYVTGRKALFDPSKRDVRPAV